jgi:hypothetical protein
MERMAVAHKMDRFFSFMGFYLFLVLGWDWWEMGNTGARGVGKIIGLKVPVLSINIGSGWFRWQQKIPGLLPSGRVFLEG